MSCLPVEALFPVAAAAVGRCYGGGFCERCGGDRTKIVVEKNEGIQEEELKVLVEKLGEMVEWIRERRGRWGDDRWKREYLERVKRREKERERRWKGRWYPEGERGGILGSARELLGQIS